jgi:hypothetical protein
VHISVQTFNNSEGSDVLKLFHVRVVSRKGGPVKTKRIDSVHQKALKEQEEEDIWGG